MIKVHAHVLAKLIELLQSGASIPEMVEETGLAYETVREYMKVWREKKVVYICDWQQDSRGAWTVAVYRLGHGKSAKKPAPRTSWQRKKDQKARRAMIGMIQATAGQHAGGLPGPLLVAAGATFGDVSA